LRWPPCGAQGVKTLLGEAFIAGGAIVGSDRWSAYNWLEGQRRQLCWAHLARDFQALAERGGESALIGSALLAQERLTFGLWQQVQAGTLERPAFAVAMQPIQAAVGAVLRQGTQVTQQKTGWNRPTTRRSGPCGAPCCGVAAALALRAVRAACSGGRAECGEHAASAKARCPRFFDASLLHGHQRWRAAVAAAHSCARMSFVHPSVRLRMKTLQCSSPTRAGCKKLERDSRGSMAGHNPCVANRGLQRSAASKHGATSAYSGSVSLRDRR